MEAVAKSDGENVERIQLTIGSLIGKMKDFIEKLRKGVK